MHATVAAAWAPIGRTTASASGRLSTVPADAAVSTLPRLASHLAHRKTLYIFPKVGDADVPVVDFVVLDRHLVAGARAAIEDGFFRIGLDEVVAFTVPANRASRRVMEKLGMTHDPAEDFEHPRLPASEDLGIAGLDVHETEPSVEDVFVALSRAQGNGRE